MLLYERPMLVMSVYGTGSEKWLDLQIQWLKKTCNNFKLVLFLNNLNEDFINGQVSVIGKSYTSLPANVQHCNGLQELSNYAKINSNKYRSFLVLDSDCFPVKFNWETNLQISMGNKNIACIVRTENLDTFPHPSAVYTTNKDLLNFSMKNLTNLYGDLFDDVVCDVNDFFPMIRTNKVNLHPLIAGIYYDIFYHHGCGSRSFGVRSFNNNYYKDTSDYECLYNKTKNMNELLKILRGGN